jgi:glycosyltransferase involved in cell wall biosynthesis
VKLLVVNWQDRLNPQSGGAEIHVHETFGRLAERGHRVALLVSGFAGAPQRERLDGMEVHRVGGRHTFGALAPGYYRRHLAAERFDAVVEALNKVPVFSPLWAGRPVVLLAHHLFGATAFREASFPLAAATWLLERPLGPVYRRVPAQAISRSTAEDLVDRGLHPGEIRVIYPGMELGFYTPAAAPARLPEPTFLYLGRLRRYKGIHFVLRAVAMLRDRGTHVRLLVGGKGDHEPALRKLAAELRLEDRVEFLGFVSEERKRELFRTVWANVFPSPKEGWGITNLEAAACGTPTVASDSPGLRESVLDGRTGTLVPHGDVAALAAALEALAKDPARVEALGREALDFAGQFTWQRTADETEAHLLAVTAE